MSSSAGYSGTPLPKKLGVTEGTRVLLDGAPQDFSLAGAPAGVVLHRQPPAGAEPADPSDADPYDVVLAFCPDSAALHRRWPVLHPRTTGPGALWIAWPKKAARTGTDLDENLVREFGLANGRVDVKVCAVDETWSGLKFVVRLSDRGQR
ncbi:MAG: hypothetical protein QOJ50_3763 [Cryptosporangiaceae bacterium]|nr:hypothetical protein [Cryptosporangiaceae bacterium]